MPPDLVQASQTLQGLKAHLQQLHQQASAEKQKKLQRWHDELPMVESYIAAMASTKEIIQKEQKQLKQELANVKEHLERQAAQFKPAAGAASADTAALQQQLAELRERLTTIDGELQQLQPLLAGGCRPEERPLYETKLVVLQVRGTSSDI
jgi:predicted  nucleic acid-binding Zn-ribbon protein